MSRKILDTTKKKKTLSVCVDDNTRETLEKMAFSDYSSISNLISRLVSEEYERRQKNENTGN